MSKLRDRIRDMSRRRTATFGFTAVRTEERPARQLLVMAEVGDASAATAAIEAGADILLHGGAVEGLASVVAAAGSTPAGQLLEAATADSAAAVIEAGAHFLVFNDQQTEAAALLKPALGYVAIVDPTDSELRLLRPLDLDAVIVLQPAAEPSVREQLRLRRTSELVRKPLIARLEGAVSATTLEVWRDAGIVAVLVGAGSDLEAVVTAADAVPRPRESTDRPEATIPSVQANMDDDDDD
jgi:hypothetical protein